jgi:C4-type Zn-finger protein
VIIINKLKYIFNKWNNLEKCPWCKTTKTKEINIDRLDGYGSTVLEYDIVCANCGHHINHWAYGYIQEPETKTEYIKRYCNFKYNNWLEAIKEFWWVLWQ